jgi:hypothetical protein
VCKGIHTIPFVVLAFVFILSFNSCCDTPSYPSNSILGTWQCLEEGALNGYRQYTVSISYQRPDTTTLIIYNFYNLGLGIRTYATVSDTLITLVGTDSYEDFTGTGHIERDFSAIYWEFSYYGFSSVDQQVEAVYRRP